MAVSRKTGCYVLAVLVGLCIAARTASAQGRIDEHLELTWGNGTVSAPDGQVISLVLDRNSGSGFQSRDTYMYARTDIQIKLVPNNSAGTVATCFFLSEGGSWETHDEIDLEFLGNVSGQPYTLHTNIFASGIGRKEQQFRLWFDATADFHTYSIVWTPRHILLLVDGTPIREFKNITGVAYPSAQRMRLYGSLWDAEDWATQGGRIKTNWTAAPFVAQYRNFVATTSSPGRYSYYDDHEMDGKAKKEMQRTRDQYMIYNYCTDKTRFPNGPPPNCY